MELYSLLLGFFWIMRWPDIRPILVLFPFFQCSPPPCLQNPARCNLTLSSIGGFLTDISKCSERGVKLFFFYFIVASTT